MKIYKFVQEAYADAFARGVIRISAAHMMRPFDGLEDGRADPDELVSKAFIPEGDAVFAANKFGDMFVHIRRGERVPVPAMIATGQEIIHYDNALLFCAALKCDDEMREMMNDKFAAGIAFEISDVDEFAALVTKAIRSTLPSVSSPVCDRVAYTDEEISFDAVGPGSYFRKKAKFSWQKEFRMVWECDEPESLNIENPQLSKLVRKV